MTFPRKAVAVSFTFLAALLCLSQPATVPGEVSPEAELVISRYIEAMGGLAALEEIQSIRLQGTVRYPDGSSHSLTVLKKKPDLVRVTIDTGRIRFIQGYDASVAWIGRETSAGADYSRMPEPTARAFIREAPLANILLDPRRAAARISLGEETTLAGNPAYLLIADLPDGFRFTFTIEKTTYLERRIHEYAPDGTLLAELIPSHFESHAGVLFAMQVVRREQGTLVSTMSIEEVDTNIGLLDTVFSPPVPLPLP